MQRSVPTALVLALILALASAVAVPLHAGGKVEEKTRIEFGKGMGLLNRFGGPATKEGLVTTTVLEGDRKRTRAGDRGEYVSLDERRVCELNYAKRKAVCRTFDQMREQMAQVQEGLGGIFGGSGSPSEGGPEAEETVRYEVDFDIEELGPATVGGVAAEHVRWTAVAHPEGMTVEKGGGGVITADLWVGPSVPVVEEIRAFDLRYLEEIGLVGDRDLSQVLLAHPTLAAAMEEFEEHRAALDGTAVRTELVLETVRGTDPPGDASGEATAKNPIKAVRGLFGKDKKKGDDAPPEAAEPVERLRSTSELLDTAGSALPEEAAIPAGFEIETAKS